MVSQDDMEERMRLIQNQIIDTFEQEIYDNSIQFSQLLIANDNTFLDNLGAYFTTDEKEKHYYLTQLDSQFNQTIHSKSSLIGMEFFGRYGQYYYYNHPMDLSVDEIKRMEIYRQALKVPDIIQIDILEENVLYSQGVHQGDGYCLGFFMGHKKTDHMRSVEASCMISKSKALEDILSANQWAGDVSVFLVNQNKEIVLQSDEQFTKQVENFLQKGKRAISTKIQMEEIERTNWSIITVESSKQISANYRNILFVTFAIILMILGLFYWYTQKLLNNIITPINLLSCTMKHVGEDGTLQPVTCDGPEEIRVIGETYNGMIQKIENLISDNIHKEREKKKEEIMALESQINPHFISNAINSIQFMAKVAKFTSIQLMAESMNKILDVSFRNKSNVHSVQEELEVLHAYVYIMEIRYANGFIVEFDVDDACLDYQVPKLMLQPFIENAITHGFVGKEEMGEIHVSIQLIKEGLHIEIWDNGVGMTPEVIQELLEKVPQNGSKIAIANINKRLKLYYGEQQQIKITSELNQYTRVEFYIPVMRKDKRKND